MSDFKAPNSISVLGSTALPQTPGWISSKGGRERCDEWETGRMGNGTEQGKGKEGRGRDGAPLVFAYTWYDILDKALHASRQMWNFNLQWSWHKQLFIKRVA